MTSRKFFMLFILCCGLPLLAAKLYLESGWAKQGATNNKGQWLQKDIQLPLQDSKEKHWYLVYIQADACAQICEQALYTLQQIYTGFGRKQVNIKPVVLSPDKFSQLGNFPALEWQMEKQPLAELQNSLVIANQHGLAVLQYPVVNDFTQMAKAAKDIHADLKRLMNYDRGGY